MDGWGAAWPAAWLEWWAVWSSYRPSDFLMFSPRIYWRLFEAMNLAWWPAQPLLLLGAAVALLGLGWRRQGAMGEAGGGPNNGLARRAWPAHGAWCAAALFMGVCSAVVGGDFLLQRFAPINWIVGGFAWAFLLQAVGWLALAGAHVAGGQVSGTISATRRRTGLGLVAWAAFGHPLLAPAAGRPWQQAEVLGLAPDPTALAALGVLLLLQASTAASHGPVGGRWGMRSRWGMRGRWGMRSPWLVRSLWLVPLSWCAFSAATLATLGSGQAVVVSGGALLAVVAALWPRKAARDR